MKTNPGDTAYPIGPTEIIGLTKREYFAAMAMQGLCANPEWVDISEQTIAQCALVQADALIKQLNQAQ